MRMLFVSLYLKVQGFFTSKSDDCFRSLKKKKKLDYHKRFPIIILIKTKKRLPQLLPQRQPQRQQRQRQLQAPQQQSTFSKPKTSLIFPTASQSNTTDAIQANII